MDKKSKLQRKLRNKREGLAQVQAEAKAEREKAEAEAKAKAEAEAKPKLTKKEKEKAKKQRQKKAKKDAEAKEGGYYVDKIEQKKTLANMLDKKFDNRIEKENALIELQIAYNKRNPLNVDLGDRGSSEQYIERATERARLMKLSADRKFIGEFFDKDLDDPMVMDEAYEEYGRRMKDLRSQFLKDTVGIDKQIDMNKSFNEYMEKREQKKKQQEINRQSAIEGRQPIIRARELLLGGEMIGEIPKSRTEEETKERGKEIASKTDETSFLISELGRIEERSAKNRLPKYQVRNDFNQPNADKFGKDATGNPRSRKEFAHRFRGKTETEVSDMIDQEVRDRTPEQRGAFLQRAVGTLKSQDITDEGILQTGGNRVGAGEFIASQLAKKDIEQIIPEPSKRGFISKEFTPDNMRKIGAISQEEEGVLGIKKRREQQYIKEWSADGTTMKSTGLATLDQEKYTMFQEREDALLNAVAGNLETVFFRKSGIEKAIDVKEEAKQQFEEKTKEAELLNRRVGGIQTEFRNTDKYLQAQRNYAIQKEFIDIIQKSQQAEDIFSQYQLNNTDFTSTGYVDSPYVDTDLNFNGGGGYGKRFYQLIGEGQQPLQFLLNTKTNEILKFAGDNMMSGDGSGNGIGDIAVVNEVNMGGRIAFIGHTRPQFSNPNPLGVGQQGGNLRGASYGYMSVFSNPYEENSPLVQQNRFLPTTELNKKSFFSYTQRQFGDPNIKGLDFGISVAGGKNNKSGPKRQDVSTKFGTSEDIYIRQLNQKGGAKNIIKLAPDYEQIRKGTFLPKEVQPLDQTTLRKQLRTRQLNAQFNLSTTALQKKGRIGLQGMK